MRTFTFIFVFGLFIALSAPAYAESSYVVKKNGHNTIKYKKENRYSFDGASIDGTYNKPGGSFISNIRDVRGRSVIKIRSNFDAEVIDSARWVQ